MNYDLNHFIKKFEAIPEDKWTTNTYQDHLGRSCALGHCQDHTLVLWGQKTQEYFALVSLATDLDPRTQVCVFIINDGDDPDFQQPTPKARILAWLKALKEFYS